MKIFKFLIISGLVLSQNKLFSAETNNKENSLKNFLFPSAIISYGAELFLPNKKDYKWSFYRQIKFTIIKYNNLTFSFSLYEKHIMGNKDKAYYRPHRILYYPLDFLNVNYKTRYGIGGFVLDHECYNTIDKERDPKKMYRWYGAALTWQSANMYPNSFSNYINIYSANFVFLNSFNYYLYAGRSLDSVGFDYKYIFKINTRYDIFQIYNIAPYLNLYFTAIKDSSIKLNYTIGIGSRIYFQNTYLSPFIRYNYLNDIEDYNNDEGGFWSGGFQVTASTYNYSEKTEESKRGKGPDNIFFKAVNARGEYGRYLNSDYFGYRTDIKIRVNFINLNIFSLNHSSQVTHISMSGAADMFPRYLKYSFNNYLNIKILNNNLQFLHSYNQFHEGNFYKEYFSKYHLIGIVIKSNGIEPVDNKNGNISIISEIFNWKISLGHIIKENYYPYSWDFAATLRINFLNQSFVVPYFLPAGTFLYSKQNDSTFKYSLESGVALKTNHIFDIYYRFEYCPDTENFTDTTEKLHLLGIRFTY